ncbi:hypothetical protein NQ317_001296, partial [Molorchus minor]
GSLPCDVNSSVIPTRDYQFLEEARKNKETKNKEYTAIDMESESLLEHRFVSSELSGTAGANVDDPIPLDLDSAIDKKPYDLEALQTKVVPSQYGLYIPPKKSEEKTVMSSLSIKKLMKMAMLFTRIQERRQRKRKYRQIKRVVVLTAESCFMSKVTRSDIIDDVDKLMQYIGGDEDGISSGKTKSNVHKSKQLHKQHASEDGGRSKKQRAHSSKGKESRSELKKSNSLGEISTAMLDEFAFASGSEKDTENKVVLRPNKGQNDRPKERRSWGNVEPPPIQSLYSNASAENLETSENWVVTKPKKKSKKRRNSISSSRRQNSTSESNAKQHVNRVPSPDLRGKSTCSVPHSEKSNDSSDVDSVHSLPIDGLNMPISYADIAKNSEKLKEKKMSPEKSEKVPNKEKSPTIKIEIEPKLEAKVIQTISTIVVEKQVVLTPVINNVKNNVPPDVHNIKSFPAIPNNNKTLHVSVEKTNLKNNTVSNKVKNVSPSNKNPNKTNSNNNVKVNTVALPTGVIQNDIQNDLSIIHSNEKDSIQFNAQRLPPDIPDVQTIEKLHFMNRPIQINQQHLYQAPAKPPTLPLVALIQNPLPVSAVPPPQLPVLPPLLPAPPIVQNSVPVTSSDINSNNVSSNCDSSERTFSDEEEGPPPVVILSGLGNKEVPGLVFGFDVNEQLLNEDICENFISRYVAPETFTHSSHNHDKIVNFIGSAWETIVNQSNGKVQYYSEDS